MEKNDLSWLKLEREKRFEGGRCRVLMNKEQEEWLKKEFHRRTLVEIAEIMCASPYVIDKFAKRLGLQKTAADMERVKSIRQANVRRTYERRKEFVKKYA